LVTRKDWGEIRKFPDRRFRMCYEVVSN